MHHSQGSARRRAFRWRHRSGKHGIRCLLLVAGVRVPTRGRHTQQCGAPLWSQKWLRNLYNILCCVKHIVCHLFEYMLVMTCSGAVECYHVGIYNDDVNFVFYFGWLRQCQLCYIKKQASRETPSTRARKEAQTEPRATRAHTPRNARVTVPSSYHQSIARAQGATAKARRRAPGPQ